jgi:autotransporter-associated beta strand protein
MVTVEKIGSGLIVLSGVSVYSGSTRIIGGAIRVASDGALGSTAGGTIIRGGTNSGRLELIGDVTVGDVLTLEARGGAIPAHVVSIAGSNAITNSIRTVSGGLGYGLQTDNGTLSIAGNIEQITPQTYDRPLYLRGSGTAAIAGYIRGNGGFDLNLIKSDAGTWSIAGDIAIASIAVDAGTLKLDTPVRRVMAVSGVSITGTGVLDVTRNVLEIAYTGVSPFASLYPAVVNGNRAGGSGGAPRIIQSTGVAYRTVGMYDSGVSIRVGYAAIGDGNMNGAVTRVDLDFLTRAGFRGAPMAGTQWTTGDWNYNGFTTSTDLNLLTASGMFNTGFYQ